MRQYLAITSRGLENLLADELKELGVEDPKPVQAGVKFKADQELIYRCCLWSRIASRFIQILSEFTCNDDMDLYLSANSIAWPNVFHSSRRFVVDFNGTNRSIRNSQYGAMKVKDAVVDHFVKKNLPRPTIDKDRADLRLHVRLHKDQAILGVDMVGGSLHIRGYRRESGGAPLRETLAAALIRRSGWTPDKPLLDPMCGSGTLLIEACLIAANIAPGSMRHKWGFESLIDFNADVWNTVKAEASVTGKRGLKQASTPFFALDIDRKLIEIAKANARRAGVDSLIEFKIGDAAKLQCPENFADGFILSNPPYGERLGTEPSLIALYSAFGAQLKQFFPGCQAALLSSNDELLSCLRMRAGKHYKIANGSLQCHFKIYDIAVREEAENANASGREQQSTLVAPDFSNRLKKNFTKLAKWAGKEGLDCFRVYDADLPEYNAAIDIYGEFVVVQEYAAPKSIAPEKAKRRLTDMLRAIMNTLDVESNNVILKVRERQKGKSQYQALSKQSEQFVVQEYGASFIVNLQDYLDTGLFLDHRLTRRMLGQMAADKRFLNLFAYTGSASVHAANGGAASTTTVDMSKTYLDWARQNMSLNGHEGVRHQFIQADCLQWLEKATDQYDLIFIDPPTFSNSKRMSATFDVQRDHLQLLSHLERILSPDGTIVFSNNKRHFKMDIQGIEQLGLNAENISSKTLPVDFSRNKQIHNCWLVTRNK
ncbi:bifunctional 23S rRNA (guanine(2069)-N(7))-methyltransferase RlmK/23S rRNA (guanine(2445)-N(2))-methyltransferase RlmL [Vibrio salinus]|uniref:bifunctional 23S rRNA (guanine(2069)-N(7))-methyltransferase RlmK/23S rRNA (guanine(2445)-N(2))-methyltransferase RlmL n=1 Tax=Vibrio salinus TaxID=2899784 RepID=UPI001E5FA2BF|nr:bifunctional 23S rRNA (guanine(2069)-N(7))-methyltransferase RlmK/23S rRNA (guanine(2445)-N(2))-methyltransferase RlmL [Vibrio salinus]MCE0492553.1 bifunctional 23S rRNA (guanine(2069)-N(7))-methyltransferase RlmK/23S rRNA (guanine(2445)-N(2))-methyltransferase RlmL [Vibrio salinus]